MPTRSYIFGEHLFIGTGFTKKDAIQLDPRIRLDAAYFQSRWLGGLFIVHRKTLRRSIGVGCRCRWRNNLGAGCCFQTGGFTGAGEMGRLRFNQKAKPIPNNKVAAIEIVRYMQAGALVWQRVRRSCCPSCRTAPRPLPSHPRDSHR